ncbi:MAG: hypothetical protein OHK0048_21580 [Rhodoferax sp.]
MSTPSCFIEPLDVLFLRGNKLFGDPGSHGESLVPPWPSVVAGALRSRILADDGVDLNAFAAGRVNHVSLGTPAAPGPFTVTGFHLARRFADGRVEVLHPPPADLVIGESDTGTPVVRRLTPTRLADGLAWSGTLPLLPVLAEAQRGKPAAGYWLGQSAWQAYLEGRTPAADDLVRSKDLWSMDHRVGVGLDAEHGRAADGHLFSLQAVALHKRHTCGFDVGFAASIDGAALPQGGLLRLGGDGRGATLHCARLNTPTADLSLMCQQRRCRIVLTTPGLFADGWRLPGCAANGQFDLYGVRGTLVCAAVARAETVSGWDLARHAPKPAQRVAPTGSVYWLESLDATPDQMAQLVRRGLWGDPCEDPARRAEGFNRFVFAVD